MFSCWIFQILNGSDTVALTCDFAEDFVYQIGKLFFEDDDQTDQYNENQDNLYRCNSLLIFQKCLHMCHIFSPPFPEDAQ
jgi:hypothetical protein